MWLLTLRPSQWASVMVVGSLPSSFDRSIHKAWSNKLSFMSEYKQLTVDIEFGCGIAREVGIWVKESRTGPRILRLMTNDRRLSHDKDRYQIIRNMYRLFTTDVSTFLKSARDSFPLYVLGPMPRYRRKQRALDPAMASQLTVKISDAFTKTYIALIENVFSYVDFLSKTERAAT